MSDLPQQTLVLLVTCSMDSSRRDLAVQVVKNLAEKIPDAGLSSDFILFDNASALKDHIPYAPQGTKIIQSANNIGYWTAIKWVLENAPQVMGRDYKYIYMVESDLYHTDLKALGECEDFLDSTPDASCVRTQEFSVKQRWRFDKGLKFLPFHVARSEIRLLNLATNEKAWFKKTTLPHIYKSNLHAKLPALNRMDALKSVFSKLEQQGDFSEGDFFAEMVKIYPHIGVYDGGLFYSIYSRENMKTIVSGSYSDDDQLKKIGYQTTRYSRIVPVTQNPEIKIAS